MDQMRRKIVATAPLLPLAGLAGCGGGNDTPQAAASRETAAATGSVNGLGLQVRNPYYWLGYRPDLVFWTPDNLRWLVPGAEPAVQALLAGSTLHAIATELVGAHSRSLHLKLAAPAASKQYNVANLAAGDALLVVNDGQTRGHYEYTLRSGTIQVTALNTTARTIKLAFSNVGGAPTATATAPGNLGERELRLDGTIQLAYVAETAAWIL